MKKPIKPSLTTQEDYEETLWRPMELDNKRLTIKVLKEKLSKFPEGAYICMTKDDWEEPEYPLVKWSAPLSDNEYKEKLKQYEEDLAEYESWKHGEVIRLKRELGELEQ